MVCFGRGNVTFAFFQKFASVGRASGSASIALLISLSLNESRRFQSVLPPLAEALPVCFSFMPFCPPCRNDTAFGLGNIRVNHGHLKTVRDADRVDSNLPIVEPVVHLLQRWAVENPDRILERNSMAVRLLRPFLRFPNVVHRLIFTLCIYATAWCKGSVCRPRTRLTCINCGQARRGRRRFGRIDPGRPGGLR